MDEARLIEKLRRVEALFAGAATEGERDAAEHARRRILDRLKSREKEDPPVEFRFSMTDMWSRKVFLALLRRYEIRPYRKRGQRYTTVMARLPAGFVDETLWPEFTQISQTLHSYLSEVTDRVIHEVLHRDSSEAEEDVREPEQLNLASEAVAPSDSAPTESVPPDASGAGAGRRPGTRGKNRRKKKRRK